MESSTISYLVFLLANLVLLGVSTAHNNTSFLQCLTIQYQDSNIIYTSDNKLYSSIFESKVRNQRAASSSSQRPQAIIVPTQESEIQVLINCLKKHDIQIRVRSGGHDYEGLSYISKTSFVMLDMRNFQSISVNTTDNTTWVQTGATLGQLYYAIAQSSKTLAFPAGACPTVGIGGHLSGGGYGMISRKHGIAIDHIIDARIINADGKILERKSMGEDLFWAIRGGGGGTSFGIVIAFKIDLVHVPETVTVFNVTRSLEQNATQLVHKWQYISDKIDENLLIRLFIKSVRNRIDGNRTVQVSFTSLFLGRVDDLLQIMQENFPEMGLVAQDCFEMSWIESTVFFPRLKNESIDILLDRTGHGKYFKGKSDFVTKPIPEHGLTGLWEYLKEQEVENYAELQFSPYGGAMSKFSDYETPFPHRKGNLYMIHYLVIWTSNENIEAESYLTWSRKVYSYMTRYVSKSPRRAYFNYRDLDLGMNNERNTSYEQAIVWGYKYFKNNFNRLVDVKTKVDPSNFFRNEQSIPPKEEASPSRASA